MVIFYFLLYLRYYGWCIIESLDSDIFCRLLCLVLSTNWITGISWTWGGSVLCFVVQIPWFCSESWDTVFTPKAWPFWGYIEKDWGVYQVSLTWWDSNSTFSLQRWAAAEVCPTLQLCSSYFSFRLLAVWSAHAQFKVNQGCKGSFVQILGVSPSVVSHFLDPSLQLQPISSRSQIQSLIPTNDACASCLNSKCFLPWGLGGSCKTKTVQMYNSPDMIFLFQGPNPLLFLPAFLIFLWYLQILGFLSFFSLCPEIRH